MADMDRYVRALYDLLGQLPSPTERLHAIEEVLGRFTPTAETPRLAEEFMGELAATPERMMELRRLLAEFASPAKQLRSFEEQLATTRQQLTLMATQLEGAEEAIGRFAQLAEQLSALQEPFTKLSAAWRRGETDKGAGAAPAPG